MMQSNQFVCCKRTTLSKIQPSFSVKKFRESVSVRAVQKIGSHVSKENIFNLPIFESRRMLHPTDQGQLIAYEPQYLQLFEESEKKLKEKQEAQFLHIMSTKFCPPAFLEDAVGGLPKIGVCCQITDIQKSKDEKLIIDYEAKRRVTLLAVWPPDEVRLYKLALVEWYNDEEVGAEQITDVEQNLHSCLKEVYQINQKLDKTTVQLPNKFIKYSPPPIQRQKEENFRLSNVAKDKIYMWQQASSKAKKSSPKLQDPYQMVRESGSRGMRQELFSFACASMLEVGNIERIALAQSRDTVARMYWILEAVKPYLQKLQTQYQIEQTLHGTNQEQQSQQQSTQKKQEDDEEK